MTNYDTLKEYEAHKEPLPIYDEYKRLQEKKQKVIALIKDGRFVEALQELENGN